MNAHRLPLFAVLALMLAPLLCRAVPLTYSAALVGTNEVPSNASTATGFVTVTYDPVSHSLQVNLTFSGLTGGNASASHIHASAPPGTNAPVAVGFTGFLSATSGSYSNVFDLSLTGTYTPAFLSAGGGTAAGAEAALANAFASGNAYVNIHNQTFPGGEIRGNLVPTVPDEFPTVFLLAPLLLLVGSGRLRRHLVAG